MFLLLINIKFHELFHFNNRIFSPFLHSTLLYQSYFYIIVKFKTGWWTTPNSIKRTFN